MPTWTVTTRNVAGWRAVYALLADQDWHTEPEVIDVFVTAGELAPRTALNLLRDAWAPRQRRLWIEREIDHRYFRGFTHYGPVPYKYRMRRWEAFAEALEHPLITSMPPSSVAASAARRLAGETPPDLPVAGIGSTCLTPPLRS